MTNNNRTDHIFIDGSNLFIEGMRLSSHLRSGDPTKPVYQHPDFDFDFRIDLRKFNTILGGVGAAVKPLIVGSRSENSDIVFESAAWCGFDTVVYQRDSHNREKKVDATITMRALLAALDGTPETTRIVLVAGDADYVPVVAELRKRRYEVEVVFWAHGSHELQAVASRFIALDPFIELLRYTPVSRSTSTVAAK